MATCAERSVLRDTEEAASRCTIADGDYDTPGDRHQPARPGRVHGTLSVTELRLAFDFEASLEGKVQPATADAWA